MDVSGRTKQTKQVPTHLASRSPLDACSSRDQHSLYVVFVPIFIDPLIPCICIVQYENTDDQEGQRRVEQRTHRL